MPSKMYAFRLDAATEEKLLALAERYGSQAGVLRVAIDRLWLEEAGALRRDAIPGTLRRPELAEAQGDEGGE